MITTIMNIAISMALAHVLWSTLPPSLWYPITIGVSSAKAVYLSGLEGHGPGNVLAPFEGRLRSAARHGLFGSLTTFIGLETLNATAAPIMTYANNTQSPTDAFINYAESHSKADACLAIMDDPAMRTRQLRSSDPPGWKTADELCAVHHNVTRTDIAKDNFAFRWLYRRLPRYAEHKYEACGAYHISFFRDSYFSRLPAYPMPSSIFQTLLRVQKWEDPLREKHYTCCRVAGLPDYDRSPEKYDHLYLLLKENMARSLEEDSVFSPNWTRSDAGGLARVEL